MPVKKDGAMSASSFSARRGDGVPLVERMGDEEDASQCEDEGAGGDGLGWAKHG